MHISWLSKGGRDARLAALVLAALLLGSFAMVVRPAVPAQAAAPARYTLATLHAVTGESFTAAISGNPVNGAGLIAGYVGDSSRRDMEAAVFDTRTSTVRHLGFLVPGRPSFANDVNIRGDVVGSAFVGDNVVHAFALRAGTNKMIDLGPSDATINSGAYSINDRGVVAGWMDDSASSSPNRYAVTWTLGASSGFTMYNIGKAVGSPASIAVSVNNGGYVLFERWDKGVMWSFVWFPEKHFAMRVKGLPGEDLVQASDINDAGFVVGVSGVRASNVRTPYLWSTQTQTTQALPASPGSRYMTPTAINANGTIVGSALFVQGNNSQTKPVVWDRYGASIANLPIGSNPSAVVFGINVFGLAVGQLGQGGLEGAVVWKPTKT